VYFAPDEQTDVGVLDTVTKVFTTIATPIIANTWSGSYSGAVAVGTKVYFVPCGQVDVGVLDTISGNFSTVTTGLGDSSYCKYSGGAAVGTTLYFAPKGQSNVAGGSLRTSTRPTLNLLLLLRTYVCMRGLLRTSTRPSMNLLLLLRVCCMSIHTQGKSCCDLVRVPILNDPPTWESLTLSATSSLPSPFQKPPTRHTAELRWWARTYTSQLNMSHFLSLKLQPSSTCQLNLSYFSY